VDFFLELNQFVVGLDAMNDERKGTFFGQYGFLFEKSSLKLQGRSFELVEAALSYRYDAGIGYLFLQAFP
jgi:hypothetical protein